MYSNPSSATAIEKPNRIIHREQNVFMRKLRSQVGKEIHLKIEQDDAPITYILK